MLRFILRKMIHKRYLALSLILGNLLLVAIAASSPMYTAAALQRMLTSDLGSYLEEKGQSPTVIQLFSSGAEEDNAGFVREEEILGQEIPDSFGVEPLCLLKNLYFEDVSMTFSQARSDASSSVKGRVGCLYELEQHARIQSGRLYSDTRSEDGAIEVVISQKCMVNLHLLVGDELTMHGHKLDGKPVRLRVVGVYTFAEEDDPFWFKSPSVYYRDLMMSPSLFEALFVEEAGGKNVRALMFSVMDYRSFQAEKAELYLCESANYKSYFKEELKDSYNEKFSDILTLYLAKAARVAVTLRILQVPIYALLLAFLFMVSRQMLELEAGEIAVIKSRGASRGQIIGMYAMQSLMLSGIGLVLGLPFAMLLCQMVGSANAFLEFVSRRALHVRVDREVLKYALAAAGASMVFMVLPVFRHSKVNVVARKQSKGWFASQPLWQKLFLDVICLGVSLYGLYSFYGQREILAQKVQDGAGLDPLLFLCSSLFILGAGLLAIRCIPLLVAAVYRLGRKHWSPPLYTALLYVLRTRNSQGHILIFLVVTIALGIFNAQTARTINQNETDRIGYTYGADIVLQEVWRDNSQQVEDDPLGMTKLKYTEPDFGRYQTLEGIESVTKVLWDEKGTLSARSADSLNQQVTATIVGIHTKEFGQTVDFKDGLTDIHWYHYLNAMSGRSAAILVSANLQEQGYSLGDSLTYRNRDGQTARGVIYGFLPYFPGFVPARTEINRDGEAVEVSNYLVVANLGYLQSQWGVTPYQVWIRAEDSTDFIYTFAEKSRAEFTVFRDAKAALIQVKNDPVIQGTNGILTVGFVVALILCAVGFLIYWVLSVTDRSLQFGIYRAMGMQMREIVQMLLCEQVCISGLGVAAGTGVGILASWLYIPLVQIAYATADTVIPLEVAGARSDTVHLLILVGLMIAVCLAVLGMIIRNMQITQALKLGED